MVIATIVFTLCSALWFGAGYAVRLLVEDRLKKEEDDLFDVVPEPKKKFIRRKDKEEEEEDLTNTFYQ